MACGDGERPLTTPEPARSARPTLRIVAMTDVSGYLEPCGCQSRPLGGIDKAAAQIRELRADAVPTLFVAAGNLFFDDAAHASPALDGAGDQAARQASWQAETLARAFQQLGLIAATPGPADLRHAAELDQLARTAAVPLLGAHADGAAAAAAAAAKSAKQGAHDEAQMDTFMVDRAGLKIGVWGLGEQPVHPADTAADDLPARARAYTQALRAQGAAVVVGLLQGDARTARRIAGGSPGLDVLVHGGADSASVPPPERIGSATLVRAARHGHGLLVIDLTRTGEGAFTDVSAWSRKAEQQALARNVADLQARIDGWRRDPGVDRALLAQQEARLARMKEQLAGAERPERAGGNTLSARFIELGPELPADPQIRALLDDHDKRINEHNRVALADVRPKPLQAGAPGYVGAQRCGECHAPAFAWWKTHAHGRAYATLERGNKQFNLGCVGCHVTGYNQPGGATVVHNQGLTDVGCESCHGPGSLHAEDPDVASDKNVTREAAEAVCTQCHNPEHSDRFVYDAYRAMLIVPGHGLPAKEPAQ